MKKYIAGIILGFLSAACSCAPAQALPNPDLADYKAHKEIRIAGGSEEVFNYPLHLTVDRQDIYFTAADGHTPLYYYLEDSAGCYVNLPQIPREGAVIYMYFDKLPEAAKTNKYLNPDKVFLFFDDFSGAKLDEEKWEPASALSKEYSVKDGSLTMKDGLIISRNFKMKQGIIEFKAKAEDNAGIQVLVRQKDSGQAPFPYEQIVYSSGYPGAEHTIAVNDIAKLNSSKPIQANVFYLYKVIVSPSGIIFERFNPNNLKQAQIQFMDVGNFEPGRIGIKANAAPFKAGAVYFDWLRVRPYLDSEPQIR